MDKVFKILYSVLRDEGEEAAKLLNAPQKTNMQIWQK